MKHVSEIVPAALQQIVNPPPKRPDGNTNGTAKFFGFEIWEAGPSWKGPKVEPQLRAMLQALHHFVMDIEEKKHPRWLSFVGTSGGGKTYLARKFWNWYQRSAHWKKRFASDGEIIYEGTWCHWPTLAAKLYGDEAEGYGDIEEMVPETMVIIDEIGAERDKSGHVRDQLFRFVGQRVDKWTIITSNLSLGQIEQDIDRRLASRMLREGSAVVEINAPDYNLKHL
jgi:hypothetical protein